MEDLRANTAFGFPEKFIFIKILPHCLDISWQKSEHDRRHTTFIMNYVTSSRVCSNADEMWNETLPVVFTGVSLRARISATVIIVKMDNSKKVLIQYRPRFLQRNILGHHEYNFANYIRKRAENNIFA